MTKGTPVRKSGILIGRVGDVELTDKDEKVLVTLEDPGAARRSTRTRTALHHARSAGRHGDRVRPDSKGSRSPRAHHARHDLGRRGLRRSDRIEDGHCRGPINTVKNTGKALTEASEQLGAAAKRVEDILNDDAQRDVRDILRDAAKSLKAIQKVLGDEENQTKLAEAMSKLPDTLDNMNRTFTATDETLRKFTERTGPDRKTPDRAHGRHDRDDRTDAAEVQRIEPSPAKPPPADQIATAMENIGEITALMRHDHDAASSRAKARWAPC